MQKMEKYKMKKTLLLLGMILIAGCAIGRPTPIPDTGSPAVRLYVEKCSPCGGISLSSWISA
jgi:hypothetical protein